MLFEGKTAAFVWESSIRHLLTQYINQQLEMIPTEHNNTSIELTNVLLHIQDVNARNQKSGLYTNDDYFKEYSDHLLDQKKNGHVYKRITSINTTNGILNQENIIVSKLRESWFSRRSVIEIWRASDDIEADYPPCVCSIQFLIRNNALQMQTYFRSNDAWTLALPDMIAFMRYQKKIARRLNIRASSYSQYVGSYHIYEQDIPIALSAFNIGGAT